MLLALRFTQVIIRKQGVAEIFFAWPETALRNLRQTFSVLVWVYVPGIVLVRMWQAADTDAGMEAARLVLVGLLGIIAVLAFWLFLPRRSILRGTEVYRPGTLTHRLRYVIFVVVVGAPVVLMAAALMGYLYTALELASRLNWSVWMGLALLLLSETAFFWILVKRRRLAIDEARRRRDAAKAQQTGETEVPGTGGDLPPVLAEPSLDIAAISNQAGRLLRVIVLGVFILGLWGIWAEVLPALHYLDSQALWNVSRTVSEADPTTGAIRTVDKLVPVTLVSLLLVFLIIAGLVVALRNIPGLLDISVYQRFNVQTGEKYAFNTLIRYVLIILAAAYVLYLLGLQWKQIQWLLAGVSVGLGFGLQEIFANFVSGLILLFERPIRVGDVVTVGDQSGRVSQIRIRATTVVNWDHRILIIPNKELITKSVLNWTLVNSLTRLVITVSVNHGSDFDRAREILLRAAKECTYVLSDPAPAAAIDKMDMNSVDFMLLAHLASGDNAMDAKHEIIARIERDLSEDGITLAVPRLDVKLTKSPPVA
jgi:potassium efflux system protein